MQLRSKTLTEGFFSTRLQPASLLHLPVEAHGQHCYSLADCYLSIHHQNSLCLAACIELRPLFWGAKLAGRSHLP